MGDHLEDGLHEFWSTLPADGKHWVDWPETHHEASEAEGYEAVEAVKATLRQYRVLKRKAASRALLKSKINNSMTMNAAQLAELKRLREGMTGDVGGLSEEEAARRSAAEEEARRRAELDARERAAQRAAFADSEAKRLADEAERMRLEQEAMDEAARKAREAASKRYAEEARRKSEEEARRKSEEEARRKAAEDARNGRRVHQLFGQERLDQIAAQHAHYLKFCPRTPRAHSSSIIVSDHGRDRFYPRLKNGADDALSSP